MTSESNRTDIKVQRPSLILAPLFYLFLTMGSVPAMLLYTAFLVCFSVTEYVPMVIPLAILVRFIVAHLFVTSWGVLANCQYLISFNFDLRH